MDGNAVSQARGVTEELLAFERMRRVAEAGTIRTICELAGQYSLQEQELIEALAERRIRPGGEGTPTVSEFLSLELAGLLRCTPTAAAGRIADALNLQYRHPRLYAAVQELEIDAARALKAARRCAGLHPIQADAVTASWLRQQAGRGWQAAFNALDKLIIESDIELAARQERRAREDRGVWTWGAFEGVMNLSGRLDVTDARLVDDRLSWFADLLADDFPTLTHAQRRAKAMGVLTDPYYAVALMEAHGQAELPIQQQCCGCHTASCEAAAQAAGTAKSTTIATPENTSSRAVLGAYLEKLVSSPPPPRWPLAYRRSERAEAPPSAPVAESLGKPKAWIDGRTLPSPAKHRPTLLLNVHIDTDALGGSTRVARVEGAGHITTRLLAELIGEIPGLKVKVQPVIDLPNLAPSDAYVPSMVMRKASILVFPNEPFPFSTRCSEGLDLDHTIAYRPSLPGQTNLGNLTPLTRGVHRAKTAGWWILEQPTPGQVRWTSPLGHHYLVTPFGTLFLD